MTRFTYLLSYFRAAQQTHRTREGSWDVKEGGAVSAVASFRKSMRRLENRCPRAVGPFVEFGNHKAYKQSMLTKISPCLWFDGQAEDAARFYTGIFKNSKIVTVARFPGEGVNPHGHVGGSVMAVEFELEGISFSALNGGPHFRFSPAVSFQIDCESQEEVDYFWDRLGEGGDPAAQQCGWLADKFGLSWQVVPAALMEMLKDADPARRQRVFNAMLQMKRLCIADLRKAYSATS